MSKSGKSGSNKFQKKKHNDTDSKSAFTKSPIGKLLFGNSDAKKPRDSGQGNAAAQDGYPSSGKRPSTVISPIAQDETKLPKLSDTPTDTTIGNSENAEAYTMDSDADIPCGQASRDQLDNVKMTSSEKSGGATHGWGGGAPE